MNKLSSNMRKGIFSMILACVLILIYRIVFMQGDFGILSSAYSEPNIFEIFIDILIILGTALIFSEYNKSYSKSYSKTHKSLFLFSNFFRILISILSISVIACLVVNSINICLYSIGLLPTVVNEILLHIEIFISSIIFMSILLLGSYCMITIIEILVLHYLEVHKLNHKIK